MDGLNGEGGVLRIKFDLAFDLSLGVAADNQKGDAGERGGEKDEGEEEFGAQTKVAGAVTQKACGRAAGEDSGAEAGKGHRASRLRKAAGSTNGTEVPIIEYCE